MKTKDIVTERLILKSMTLDDCDFAANLCGDPETVDSQHLFRQFF